MAIIEKIGLSVKSNLTSMLEDFIVSENDIQRQILQFCLNALSFFRVIHVLIK